MRGTLLNERPQIKTYHATLMERVAGVFKRRGIARDFLVDRAENRIEGQQFALQVSDRLRSFLDAVHTVVGSLVPVICLSAVQRL